MGEIYGLATWCWLLFDVLMKTISFTRNIRILVENYLLEARGEGQLDFIFNGVESSPDYLVGTHLFDHFSCSYILFPLPP